MKVKVTFQGFRFITEVSEPDFDRLSPEYIEEIEGYIRRHFQAIADIMSGDSMSSCVEVLDEYGEDVGSFDSPGWLYQCPKCGENFAHPAGDWLSVCPSCGVLAQPTTTTTTVGQQ